jgi:hypothetical protein
MRTRSVSPAAHAAYHADLAETIDAHMEGPAGIEWAPRLQRALGITVDERGVSRPQGSGCDNGAVKVAQAPPPAAHAAPVQAVVCSRRGAPSAQIAGYGRADHDLNVGVLCG